MIMWDLLKSVAMKKLIFILMTFFSYCAITFAQEPSTEEEWRKMSREERRAHRELEARQQQEEFLAVLESEAWVLEASRLQNRYGQTYQIPLISI